MNRIALAGGLASFATFLGTGTLLLASPDLGLKVLWLAIVPSAPLLFFLNTNLWVSLCPFAFVQSVPARLGFGGTARIPAGLDPHLDGAAWLLLFLLVPLRHSVFDRYGIAAALAMLGISTLSFLSGTIFAGLAGWCNHLCPVRPVELLYGQFRRQAFLPAHCAPCSACTRHCGRKSKRRRQENWTGILPLGFPGFVLGFFLTAPETGIVHAYVTELLCTSASLALLLAVRRIASQTAALRLAGGAALLAYYSFVLPRIAGASF